MFETKAGTAKGRQFFPAAAIAALLLAVQAISFAQGDRGTITGTITDSGGAVVPRAAITATNTETGARFETVSTETGNYTLVQLPAGVYSLEAISPGFGKFLQVGIRVQVAVAARIDVAL